MKLTKSKLKQIIQEELKAVLSESDDLPLPKGAGPNFWKSRCGAAVKYCVKKHKNNIVEAIMCGVESCTYC